MAYAFSLAADAADNAGLPVTNGTYMYSAAKQLIFQGVNFV
jgi:hypothetical protein